MKINLIQTSCLLTVGWQVVYSEWMSIFPAHVGASVLVEWGLYPYMSSQHTLMY